MERKEIQTQPMNNKEDLYPLDDMYYTLDLDAEDWEMEQKRLKKYVSLK
jgi:hypothetical protein